MSFVASPLQNRVLPTSEIVAIPQRGTLMGNRGCLHDDEGIIRHRWKGKRWISCVLDYKDNRVPLRKPGRYTPLFFKDEVSALAAGHRPCALCRREAYRAFVAAVERARGLNPGSLGADELDVILHEERTKSLSARSTLQPTQLRDLPNGVLLARNGSIGETRNGELTTWDWGSFKCGPDDLGLILVTSPTIVEALRRGYCPAEKDGNV